MTVGRKSQVALSSASISLHPPVASDSCKVPMGVTNKATTAARLLIERERERERRRERERERERERGREEVSRDTSEARRQNRSSCEQPKQLIKHH